MSKSRWGPILALCLLIASPFPSLLWPSPWEPPVTSAFREWLDLFTPPAPSDVIYVLDVRSLSEADSLSAVSIQGIVNRDRATLYLITADDDLFWLRCLERYHHISQVNITLRDALHRFGGRMDGFVVVDPDKPETVNVATTLSGIENRIIVHPSNLVRMSQMLGRYDVLDLRDDPWSGLNGVEIYRKAFSLFFKMTSKKALAFLRPDLLKMRDLAISQKLFTFYVEPGPFSDPIAWNTVRRILRSTASTHAVIGSIEPVIAAEEAYAIKEFSYFGRFFIPAGLTPNLSILSAYNSTVDLNLRVPEVRATLENKHYITIGIADGDNLAFTSGRMLEMWSQWRRGSFPISWTIPPLATVLAPIYLEYYARTRTTGDFFMMSPSGLGLAFPDMMPEPSFSLFMKATKEMNEHLDLNYIWLLNRYEVYEVPYSEDTLYRYVETLGLDGIAMDYDDMPVHEEFIIVSGVPAIRSTHLWKGTDNFLAKMAVHWRKAPTFTFMAVHPWSKDLDDIQDVLERLGQDYEVVNISTFFALMREAAFRKADDAVKRLEASPMHFLTDHDRARSRLRDARSSDSVQLAWDARNKAIQALAISELLAIVIFTVVITILLLLIIALLRKPPPPFPPDRQRVLRVSAMTATMTVAFGFLYDVQFREPWDMAAPGASIFLGILLWFLSRRWRIEDVPTGLLLIIAGSVLTVATSWGLILVVLGAVILVNRAMNASSETRRIDFVISLSLALSASSLLIPSHWLVSLTLTLPALYLCIHDVMGSGIDDWRPTHIAPLVAALMITGPLSPDNRYLIFVADIPHQVLVPLSPVLPICGALISFLLDRFYASEILEFCTGFLLFSFSWTLVTFTGLPLLLLLQQIGMCLAVLALLRGRSRMTIRSGSFSEKRSEVHAHHSGFVALFFTYFVLFNVMFYIPPVILDVYALRLSYWENYILYHFPMLMLLSTAVLALLQAIIWYMERR